MGQFWKVKRGATDYLLSLSDLVWCSAHHFRIQPYAGQAGIWYAADEQLWFANYEAETGEMIRPLPNAVSGAPLQLSPDEQWVAYTCRKVQSGPNDLCLLGPDGVKIFELNATPLTFAWQVDSLQLAVGYQTFSQVDVGDQPAWLDIITLSESDEAQLVQHIQVAHRQSGRFEPTALGCHFCPAPGWPNGTAEQWTRWFLAKSTAGGNGRSGCVWGDKPVAEPPNRLQKLRLGSICFDFAAQALDVCINRA